MRAAWKWALLMGWAAGVSAAPPRDGILDPSFGNGGIARFGTLADGAIEAHLLNRMVPLSDGGALLLGAGRTAGTTADPHPLVVRIDRHGAPVTTFGSGGVFLLPESASLPFGARAYGAAVLPDGRIAVVSAVALDQFLVNTRYDDCAWVFALTPAGILIPGYGPAGAPGCVDFGDSSGVSYWGNPPVGSIAAIDSQGRVLVGGLPHGLPGTGESALARLAPDGRLDTGFGAQGILRFGGERVVMPSASSGLLGNPPALLAPAYGNGGVGLLRFATDGGIDTGFGDLGFAGTLWTSVPDAGSIMGGIARDPQGRSLVAGYARTFFGGGVTICDACVSRFLPNGSLDLGFNAAGAWPGAPGSALITAVQDGAAATLSVMARADARIILAGTTGGAPGDERILVLALREDGAVDARFGLEATPGRLQLSLAPTAGGTIYGDAVLAVDGGVLLGGAWSSAGSRGIAVARLVDDRVFSDSIEATGAVD